MLEHQTVVFGKRNSLRVSCHIQQWTVAQRDSCWQCWNHLLPSTQSPR